LLKFDAAMKNQQIFMENGTVKKIVMLIIFISLGMAPFVSAADYRYVSAEDLKEWLEADKPMLLVDIQVANEFAAHHIKGSLETNAYPVKSESERVALDPAVKMDQENRYEAIVVVCPRGKGGAKRAYDYLGRNGVPESELYILTGGMEKWPYVEWVEGQK